MTCLRAEVNGLAIVEWLGKDDPRTGHELMTWIEKILRVNVAYYKCGSRADVLEALRLIKDEAERTGIRRVLQIEAHGYGGYKDVDGNVVSLGYANHDNEEVVFWKDLSLPLAAINAATDNNLVLVSAACFGHAALMAAAKVPRAAFLALVGFGSKVLPVSVLAASKELYRCLLRNGGQLRAAQENAQRELQGNECITFGIMPNAFYEYLVQETSLRILSYLDQCRGCVDFGTGAHQCWLHELGAVLQRAWDEFLFIDTVPAHRERFPFEAAAWLNELAPYVQGQHASASASR